MRLRPRNILSVLALSVSAAAILAQSNQKETDAILAADAAWMKVYHAKDLDKSLAFCAEDASMLVPSAPIATGKEAVGKLIAYDFSVNGDLTWHANKVGVARSGDLGYSSGIYEDTYQNAAGKTVHDTGKYLTIWKKQADGSWKVLFDMSNSDLPPA
jgi:ketosteroid isomerase-like protein